MVRVMIPLTGRDRQHSTFTLALQPNMSTPASANTMETWPYSPALTTESAAFPTSIPGSSFAHLDLPEAQHEKASEVHEADTCNIFASEQTEDLLFANDLSDLSVFDAIDFDDMLVHATNDMMPTQQQQQQQQLFPDQCKYPHTHLDSASYETGSLSSASAREPILPVAASLQVSSTTCMCIPCRLHSSICSNTCDVTSYTLMSHKAMHCRECSQASLQQQPCGGLVFLILLPFTTQCVRSLKSAKT